MRVTRLDPSKRTRSVAEIFSGEVESFTAVGGEHSPQLRLTEVHFKSGARNRWHVHSTDQILVCTQGEGIVATSSEQHDLAPGDVALARLRSDRGDGFVSG